MDDQNIFINLLTRIGFTQARQRDAIVNNGVLTCTDLLLLSKDDFDNIYTSIREDNRHRQAQNIVKIPISARAKLEAIRIELKQRQTCDSLPNVDRINEIDSDMAALFIKEQSELESADSITKDQLPEVAITKLTHSNWRTFKQSVLDVLSRTRGAHGIPLTYVIREQENGDYYDVYPTIIDKLVACTAHQGMQYKTDNMQVYTFLRDKTNETPAESTVAKFRRTLDGRAAWMALIALNESESYKRQLKSTAMTMIRNAVWNGPKKKFTLNDYYNVHVKAHNMLLEADSPLSDELKIQHFQDGIKEIRSIEQSTATLARVGDGDFAAYYRDLSSSLTSIYTLLNNAQSSRTIEGSDQRYINQMNSGQPQRGRGRGRGGRNHNRGGRSRGGRGRGRHTFGGQHYWQPEDKEYSNEEWSKLSHGQRQAVIHFRRGLRMQRQNDGGPSVQSDNRQINAVTNEDQSVPSQVQVPANSNRATASVPGTQGSVGSAFNGNRQP
jgi:hypothetical protein